MVLTHNVFGVTTLDKNNLMVYYGVRKLNQMIVLIDTEQELSSIGGMVNTYVDKNFEEFIKNTNQENV